MFPYYLSELNRSATLSALPSYDCSVSIDAPGRHVAAAFENNANLPGIIILENDQPPFLLPRTVFHEILGKPYGTDLFMDRPIKVLVTTFRTEVSTILPADTRIHEAANIILTRNPAHIYEPVIGQFEDQKLVVIDTYDILAAQNYLLGLSNRELDTNQKISETLRSASIELSKSLDFDEIIEKITHHISSIVSCDVIGVFILTQKSYTLIKTNGIDSKKIDLVTENQHQLVESFLEHQRNPNSLYISLEDISSGNLPMLMIPLVEKDQIMGFLALAKANGEDFLQNETTILQSYSNHASSALLNAQYHTSIQEIAVTDPLTGLLNRHGFYMPAQRLVESIQRTNQTVSIIMVDVDHFKSINDRFGHVVGDSVLTDVSNIIKVITRETDLLCRFGGDEFLILLPETEESNAVGIAKRIITKVDQITSFRGSTMVNPSISIGISSNRDISTDITKMVLEKLIERADDALYHAKLNGRHNIFVWEKNINEFDPVEGSPDIGTLIKSLSKTHAELQVTKAINREVANHLDVILENAGDAIILADKENMVKMFNKSAQMVFEYLPESILGTQIDILFPRQAGLIRRMADISINQGKKEKNTVTGKRSNGEEFPAELSVSQVEINKEKFLILICSDITERIQSQQEIMAKNKALNDAYFQTIFGWAQALELRDMETLGHSKRVTVITLKLAKKLKVPESEWENLQRGALLHDIGKMAIPDNILSKTGPLNENEWQIMRQHPIIGQNLLSHIEFLHPAIDIPKCHHEKWDGSGYPAGLKGLDIPLAARIFAISDVWDALRSDRPYRKTMSEEQARRILAFGYESHFDPTVYKAFIELLNEGALDLYSGTAVEEPFEIQRVILEHTV